MNFILHRRIFGLVLLWQIALCLPASAWCPVAAFAKLDDRQPLPSGDLVGFHAGLTGKLGEKSNIFDFANLTKAYFELGRLLENKKVASAVPTPEIGKFLERLEVAGANGFLSYREFIHLYIDAATAFSGERPYQGIHEAADAILDGGGILLPVAQDAPMDPIEMLRYRAAFIYPLQLISKPAFADGYPLTILQFFRHDLAHASTMFTNDSEPSIDLGTPDHPALPPLPKPRWELQDAKLREFLAKRIQAYNKFYDQVEKLQGRQRDVVVDILFHELHEEDADQMPTLRLLGTYDSARLREPLNQRYREIVDHYFARVDRPPAFTKSDIEVAVRWIIDHI